MDVSACGHLVTYQCQSNNLHGNFKLRGQICAERIHLMIDPMLDFSLCLRLNAFEAAHLSQTMPALKITIRQDHKNSSNHLCRLFNDFIEHSAVFALSYEARAWAWTAACEETRRIQVPLSLTFIINTCFSSVSVPEFRGSRNDRLPIDVEQHVSVGTIRLAQYVQEHLWKRRNNE
jgi:hypothetical protein